MKNILILSASTGGGHNQVAKSLTIELEEKGYNVIKIEPFKQKSKMLDFFISDGYKVLATRMPKLFGGIYKISNTKQVSKSISKATILTLKKCITKAIEIYEPVLVVSTHPLMVNVLSVLRASGKLSVPFISIVTDFVAHQSYINQYVDAYVVGSQHTKNSLISKGINESRIFTFGIPIRREFKVHSANNVNDDKFHVLLMGGSMGMSGIKGAVKTLLNGDLPMKVTVICGSNKYLKYSIENRYSSFIDNGKLKVYGFTNNVSKLMDQNDVIITKPGGLTTSEAMAKNMPMIIPFFIPGQEQENAEFLSQEGAAVVVTKISQIKTVVEDMILHPVKLDNMRAKMKFLATSQSTDNLLNLMNSMIQRNDIWLDRVQ